MTRPGDLVYPRVVEHIGDADPLAKMREELAKSRLDNHTPLEAASRLALCSMAVDLRRIAEAMDGGS